MLGLLLAPAAAWSQDTVPAATVTVTGRSSSNAASVAGFGDVPLWRSPFTATVVTTRQLQDGGIGSLSDVTRLDAGISDAYNAPGYWSQLTVRGFVLDARSNVRRDGLPINAETALPLGNKAALEVLKGTSGIQAGTSAPAGLLNLVVDRPTGRLRQAEVRLAQPGSLGAAVDVGDRAGPDGALAWRLQLDADRLSPMARSAQGHRWMAAAALDWRPAPQHLVEWEMETAHQQQPSVPGFSLLGARLPDAQGVDPRINLNNQAWSLPVVFDGTTTSLRYTWTLAPTWDLVAQAMRQQLRTDDRVAFPFGCSVEGDFSRYCSDGSFDLYDFRSEGERRTSDAVQFSLRGTAAWLGWQHQVNAGVLSSRYRARFNLQAYNWAGIGTIDGLGTGVADPSQNDQNTHLHDRSLELHVSDRVQVAAGWELWAGLRHTRMHSASVRTDGTRPTALAQAFSTPWLAVTHAPSANAMLYISAGQGVETEVVPNRPALYANAGASLPAKKSRQLEAGYKHRGTLWDWSVAAFDIRRPVSNRVGDLRTMDGQARHLGVEGDAEWRLGRLNVHASATWLQARRTGSQDPSINGLRPTNVPAASVKLQAAYNTQALPGLAVMAYLSHEGQRMVLPDNSLATPGWSRLDLALRYRQAWGQHAVVWRLGLDNAFNRRAWKEAPYQFEHAYLFPLAPRTLHASAHASF